MKESIVQALQRGDLIICDGAMGTMLQANGLSAGMIPEEWNETRPDVVQSIHQAYLEAGAQILTTNTFGANRIRLRNTPLVPRIAELARLGVKLAREVAGQTAWVAGCVGPLGELLEPYGELPVSQAEEAFAKQIQALREAGVDLLLLETHHDLEEASCAMRMAQAHTNLPIFCTFAFNAKGRTMMGVTPAQAAARAQGLGIAGVGANCGEGPAAVALALEQMYAVTTLPLVAQANAGIPQLGEGARAQWDIGAEELAQHAARFVALGARIVGGCCGTGPAHIAAIAAVLRGHSD
jgi:5-methyltetrahydrofolate--homocysteine methyltransferase